MNALAKCGCINISVALAGGLDDGNLVILVIRVEVFLPFSLCLSGSLSLRTGHGLTSDSFRVFLLHLQKISRIVCYALL